MGCYRSNWIRGAFWGCTVKNDSTDYTNFHFYVTLVWNIKIKMNKLSRTTTLPCFVFERWKSQDLILESWWSMTIRAAYIKTSPLRIWSNFLARMLHPASRFVFWFGEFRQGRQSFNDEHWCGTPANAVTVTNIEAVEKLIRADQIKGYHSRNSGKS